MENFIRKHQLKLDIVSAVVSLFSSAMGMYFVYRWGRTLQNASQETREELLGSFLGRHLKNAEYVAMAVAIYLGYKMLVFFVHAADWQRYLEVAQKKTQRANRRHASKN